MPGRLALTASAEPATGVGHHPPTTATLSADAPAPTWRRPLMLTGDTPIDERPDTDPTSGWVLRCDIDD